MDYCYELRQEETMKFARRVFLIAGVYGLIVLLPMYFLEEKNGRDFPPPITHSEYYYGFVGVAVAWQIVFLIMSRDPVRYRAMMIPAILEKASFGIPVIALFLQNRVSNFTLAAASVDMVLGVLFVVAYLKTDR
jgi:surface polysaccharide O-acyltransferase-like enzyme